MALFVAKSILRCQECFFFFFFPPRHYQQVSVSWHVLHILSKQSIFKLLGMLQVCVWGAVMASDKVSCVRSRKNEPMVIKTS